MFKLYSERTTNPNELPDVYEYENIPDRFRNQLFFILEDILDYRTVTLDDLWSSISATFSREIGTKSLVPSKGYFNNKKKEIEFFISSCETTIFLDFIDFISNVFYHLKNEPPYSYDTDYVDCIENAFIEINNRFKQNNLGYEIINDELIRIDNKHLHSEVIKPALHLIHSEDFKGAEEEFLKAFEYRRNNDNKNAILEALKSFESTMKTICDKKGYIYDPAKDTAQKLINILENNNFYPSYMNSHLTNIRTTLETGLPVLRNKNAGHGQGATVVNVSDEFTEYALNLAATNIVLLVKIYQSQK
ncbi:MULTISPECIES: STM4504/CBY_0614 family protein [Lachnospiraceae]|jgi:hypothetical protein|uniref:STM4504/CBY_0614 family protein n=1 Tax=Lachnospiraceae TaxID=186803 RepID=UPI000E4D45C4|nr:MULTISPECIES: hypothetical protein [Lachnospiraceae]MDB2010809.1 hypothetical protein [[Clostridium] symbiosum]MDB2026899.1 hypothetical protein [[Clostridium] symbiosum]RHB47650.1 hypothetical protein DW886_03585 [Enterocloster aldenensis]RHR44638.1 hypothetical protein DWX10_28770 [Clostridium sp. AF18-27]